MGTQKVYIWYAQYLAWCFKCSKSFYSRGNLIRHVRSPTFTKSGTKANHLQFYAGKEDPQGFAPSEMSLSLLYFRNGYEIELKST